MENEKHRNYSFQKLTPYEKADMEGYDQSLSFAFQKGNEDLRNIAVTGNYGSGKSSVIRSFAQNHKDLSFIYISLAHFEGVSGEDADDKYDVKVEEKIINHIVQQIPIKNIPDSGFKIKRAFNRCEGIWHSVRIAILLLVMAYFNFWPTMHELQTIKLWNVITGTVFSVFMICLGIIDVVSIIYFIIKSFNTKKKLKAIKFSNGSVEFSDQNEKSYFDQHLDEILYLFSEAKVDAIIFEDIDRFEEIDLKVLEHLRELCTLANDRIRNIDKNRKPIRFIYLVGDHVFNKYTDRTKFFDYIVPVIPVVDASNSYSKMREYFEASGDYNKLSDRFLRGVCLYLDDLRTIKNIVNEFQVYCSKLSMTAQNPNQLLALIVYKNIYPDDFSELQRESGYLYRVLNHKTIIVETEISQIEQEIGKLKEKLETIDNETLISVEELNAIKTARQTNPTSFKDYSYKDWVNNIYPGRSESIKARSNNEVQKIRTDIVEKEKNITHIRNRHLSELINDSNEMLVFEYEKTNDGANKEKYLRQKSNNQLVEFFVKNGFIDETTYRDYIALFYEKGMNYKDKDFLIAVNSHNGKSFDYEIHDIGLVIENLDSDDFMESETRNFSITDYLFEHNKEEYIQKFIYQLQDNRDFEYIAQYLRVTKHKASFITALNKLWTGSMVAMISNDNQVMSLEEIQEYLLLSLAHIGEEELKTQNIDNLISLYIAERFIDASCTEKDCEIISNSLLTLDVQFTDVDKQIDSECLRNAVYTRDLYILNRNNVESILRSEYGLSFDYIKQRELSAVFSDPNQPLSDYVETNINEFITNVVLENAEIHDDSDTVLRILNNENVLFESKEQYISLMTLTLESLCGVDESLWKPILIHNRVNCNSCEIFRFYKVCGITNELVEFINNNDVYVDYTTNNDDETKISFFEAIAKENKLSDEHYREIAQQIGNPLKQFNISGLGDKKVLILIEENLLPMNLSNLRFIRQNYPEKTCVFVEKDVNSYLGLIQGNNLIQDELIILLEDQKIDVDSRKRMVDLMPSPISIKDSTYDDEIIIHILNKKYDIKDMFYLIENYNHFSKDVQEAIYRKIRENVIDIKNHISSLASNFELICRIFEDEKITVDEKADLMDQLIANDNSVDLEPLIEKMGFANMTKLVSGDTSRLPVIKNGLEEKCILRILKKHGYIENFSEDNSLDTIKVERKKARFKKKKDR